MTCQCISFRQLRLICGVCCTFLSGCATADGILTGRIPIFSLFTPEIQMKRVWVRDADEGISEYPLGFLPDDSGILTSFESENRRGIRIRSMKDGSVIYEETWEDGSNAAMLPLVTNRETARVVLITSVPHRLFRIWDTRARRRVADLVAESDARVLAISPSGNWVLGGRGRYALLYDLSSMDDRPQLLNASVEIELPGERYWNAGSFSPDSRYAIIAERRGNGSAILIDVVKKEVLREASVTTNISHADRVPAWLGVLGPAPMEDDCIVDWTTGRTIGRIARSRRDRELGTDHCVIIPQEDRMLEVTASLLFLTPQVVCEYDLPTGRLKRHAKVKPDLHVEALSATARYMLTLHLKEEITSDKWFPPFKRATWPLSLWQVAK